jgi:hypothetical protein
MKSQAKEPESKPGRRREWSAAPAVVVRVGACRAAGTATVEHMTVTGRRDGHRNFASRYAAKGARTNGTRQQGSPSPIFGWRDLGEVGTAQKCGVLRQEPHTSTHSRRTAGDCDRVSRYPGGGMRCCIRRVGLLPSLHWFSSLKLGPVASVLRSHRPLSSLSP